MNGNSKVYRNKSPDGRKELKEEKGATRTETA
jgi:hypothetical protein